MITIELDPSLDASRAARLRAGTHDRHEALDARLMTGAPFASIANYARFLQIQHGFHRDIDALYSNPALDLLLPDLAGRRRFGLIEQDLADIGVARPSYEHAPVFACDVDQPTALGWLYAAEGSNLGAGFLLKYAIKLGLSETYGARHLAAAPEGRGRHWKTFTQALDAIPLNAADEERLIAGGRAAFARVVDLVEELLPQDANRNTSQVNL